MRFITLPCVLALSACATQTSDTTNLEDVEAIGRIAGVVTDTAGVPLEGVSVTLQDMEVITDSDGRYLVDGVSPSDDIRIVMKKDGFATGFVTSKLVSWEMVNANGVLLPIDGQAKFMADRDSEVEAGEMKLRFPANSIVDEHGDVYRGEVTVKTSWLDPSDEMERRTAPGELKGLTAGGNGKDAGEEVHLQSFGMGFIGLYGADGEELEMGEGNAYTAEMPGTNDACWDTSGCMTPGGDMPMWDYDVDLDIWVEIGIGEVTVNPNGYMVTYSATGTWVNIDVEAVVVCARGRIVDEVGWPIRGAEMWFEAGSGGGIHGTAITDEDGYYTIYIDAANPYASIDATTSIPEVSGWSSWTNSGTVYGAPGGDGCYAMPDMDIPVCRETGMVATDNLSSYLSEVDEADNGDRMYAGFWYPPGDPADCADPWGHVPMDSCTVYDPNDFPTYGALDEDGLPTMMLSVGAFFQVETPRDSYGMTILQDGDRIKYAWDDYDVDMYADDYYESNELDFQGGDVLSATAPGNTAEYLGPILEDTWVTIPAEVELARPGTMDAYGSSGMTVEYAAENTADGILVMLNAVDHDGTKKDGVVCRFSDDGKFSVPGEVFSETFEGARYGGMGVYRAELGHVNGPDGYPIRVQSLSGSVVELEIH